MTVTKRRIKALPVARPPGFDKADVYAVKALFAGQASETQQKRAMTWILNAAAGIKLDPFQENNARLTDYMTGRQSVGRMILELVNAEAVQDG